MTPTTWFRCHGITPVSPSHSDNMTLVSQKITPAPLQRFDSGVTESLQQFDRAFDSFVNRALQVEGQDRVVSSSLLNRRLLWTST